MEMETQSFRYKNKSLGTPITAAIDVFVLPTALQHDLVIRIPLDAPHHSLGGFDTLPQLALISWNRNILQFRSKIAMESAKAGGVVFIIADSEKLPAAKDSQIKHHIIGRSAVNVGILQTN